MTPGDLGTKQDVQQVKQDVQQATQDLKQELQQVKQEILLELHARHVRTTRLYIVGITLILTAIGVATAALAILH